MGAPEADAEQRRAADLSPVPFDDVTAPPAVDRTVRLTTGATNQASPPQPLRRAGAHEAPSVVFRVANAVTGTGLLEVRCRVDRLMALNHLLSGELCAYSAPLLARYLEAERAGCDVVLDTSGLTFIDSTGIRLFLELGDRWRERGRTLQVANPSAAVCRVVAILGLEEHLFARAPARARRTPDRLSTAEDVRAASGDLLLRGSDAVTRPAEMVVRNLERGQCIEVVVSGEVDDDTVDALVRRLDILSAKRQPSVLRVDLASAIRVARPAIVASLAQAAAALDAIGSRLVVIGADPTLVDAMPADLRVRSVTFEWAPADGSEPAPVIDLRGPESGSRPDPAYLTN